MNMTNLITLGEAAALFPRLNGRRPHTSTLWRWARRGCRGVKLDYVRCGVRIVTTQEAVEDFMRRLALLDATPLEAFPSNVPDRLTRPNVKSPPTRTAAQRARDVARAIKSLRDMGV